jgi:predicted dehydrogenase
VAPAWNIGQVGCGEWGRLVLRDLVALGAKVHVVARSDKSRRNAAAAASVVGTIAELPDVAGIVVVVPTLVAPGVLTEALARGVPVFTEKPLSADPASALELARLGAGRLFVMDKWRYLPAVRYLAGLARSGELGAPVGLHCRRLGPVNPRRDVDPVLVLAPHDLAIAREVFGFIPTATAAVGHRDEMGVGGLTALLGSSPWLTIEVSGRHPQSFREFHLHLEHGSALLEGHDLEHVQVFSAATGDWRTVATPGEAPLLAELRAFLLHLDGGPPPLTSAAEAAESVVILDEVRRLAGVRG